MSGSQLAHAGEKSRPASIGLRGGLLDPKTFPVGTSALPPRQQSFAATRPQIPPSVYQRSTGPVSRQTPIQQDGFQYGNLYAPPVDDLAELRRQQAEFARIRGDIEDRNSWLAIPALAPFAVVAGLEGGAAIAARTFGPKVIQGPLNFLEREAWQRDVQPVARALTGPEKGTIREAGRKIFARANGIEARDMQAEVHHSDPLEWAHLKPNADPNRLANLWGLRPEAHDIASREWAAFNRTMNGRTPTQAELMEAKLRIDRLVEAYIRRGGVPRSRTPPRKGGPL